MMAQILLDTNILSELMRPAPYPLLVQWLNAQFAEQLFVNAVTRAEIELGIALLPEGKRKLALSKTAQEMFMFFTGRSLPFDDKAGEYYAQIVAARNRKGRPISVEDAQIAAIARANNLALATRNSKDFIGIAGLNVINPWELADLLK